MGQARPAFAADCAKQGSVMSAGTSRIRIFAADDDPNPVAHAAFRAPLLRLMLRRRLPPPWAVISRACGYWQARLTPSIRTSVSPSTFIPLGACKMVPAAAYGITQTSDGFLWFIAGDMDDIRRRSLYSLGWTPERWFNHQRRPLWPNSECLWRPRRWALGIWVAWDRSPERSGGHFSVRVGRAWESSKL